MIEEVVPQFTSRSLVAPPLIEASTVDHVKADRPDGRSGDQDDFLDSLDRVPGRRSDYGALHLVLPGFMMDELRWVADQEGRDMQELVLNAVDEFLADHWIRNPEI